MGRNSRSTAAVTGNRERLFLEKGSIRKKWKNRLPIALIYPNHYALGMSNLGLQLVYHLLNQNDAIVAERVFLPETDAKPVSLESGRPLADFPLLFFSVSFEEDYQNLIMLLEMSGISSLAAERTRKSRAIGPAAGSGQPLVIAGGVATFMNPEPLAPFIDLFIVGEAEPLLDPVMERLLRVIYSQHKSELLEGIGADLPGCYVPALYQDAYSADGNFLSHTPLASHATLAPRIKKVIMETPGNSAGHSRILTPLAEFSDLYMTELGRGCSRGCRFCAAGFIYRPPRLWEAQPIINAIDARPEGTSRIGLLGMEMALPENVALLADHLSSQSCSLSFSSLRADIISSPLIDLLGSSNLKSAAIAPDGGSERLRKVVNKGITESDVLTAAELLAEKGIQNLKLYFMIGLPTELPADLEEMVDLIMKVKKKILHIGRGKGRLGTLTLSINCFIPKPWTPFQFHPMENVKTLKQKFKFLRKKIAGEPNIRIKTENPDRAFFQAVLSRGDRKVGRALWSMVRNDCSWKMAFRRERLEPAAYASRPRDAMEPLPWEIIDHGIDRQYLWKEYKKALAGQTTIPCNTSKCKRCGVC